MNRRAFLSAIPLATLPQPAAYRLHGYTATGGWAVEIAGAEGLARVRLGLPLGRIKTWVSADRWNGRDWDPLD
jgi:hypothetical protein